MMRVHYHYLHWIPLFGMAEAVAVANRQRRQPSFERANIISEQGIGRDFKLVGVR